MSAAFTYVGSELELFAAALNWKGYFSSRLSRYLGRRVLEVGAGLGETTGHFCRRKPIGDWLCLEPDPALASRLQTERSSGRLPDCCRVFVGTLESLPEEEGGFDTVLYVDVLEHIEDDRAELERAAARLAPGGRVVVLAPAHGWLYSPFDRAIGHYRRYTTRSLGAARPASLEVHSLFYLDAVGLVASLANRMLLKQSMPTARQIAFWDRCLVPCSRLVDGLLGYGVGKSVVGVFRKP
jgi:SAM-dependent methyltransferase